MIDVCTRYEEHLSIGSRITRDVIAKQRRTDLIYQRCVPRSKPFPPAYCHYTRIIGNEQQEHDSWCTLGKPCKSKANPKPSRDSIRHQSISGEPCLPKLFFIWCPWFFWFRRNDNPYSNWVVVKEVITKRYFWFRVDIQRGLQNSRSRNSQCMDK